MKPLRGVRAVAVRGADLRFVILLAYACLWLSTVHAEISADEQRLLAGLDAGRVLTQIQHLSQEVVTTSTGLGPGSAVAGSAEESALATDLESSMRRLGLDVHVEEFPVRAYRYGPVMLTANGAPISAISLHAAGGTWGSRDGVAFTKGNAADGHRITAPLLDAGNGYAADYDQLGDVHNRVVLVRREMRDWPSAQITEAAIRGAAAILFYDYLNSADQVDALRQDSLWAHEQIPALAITRRTAGQLKKALAAKGVVVALENRLDVSDGLSRNVIGIIRGSEVPDEWAVVAAHYDRWFQGAGDNTSGVASMLEVARAFATSGLRPRRSVMFMATGSEEAGLEDPERDWLAGSHAFVQRHPEILRNAALIFNLDLVGWTSPQGTLMSTPDTMAAQRELLADLELASSMELAVPTSSAIDAWNFGVVGGAATNHLWRATLTGNPAYFPLYHTQLDVFRPDYYQNLPSDLRLITLSLWRAAEVARLPIALTAVADHVDPLLVADAKRVPEVSFVAARAALAGFRAAAAAAEARPTPADASSQINHLLLSTRHTLIPWLYASNDDFEMVVRTGEYARRVEILDAAATALKAGDRAAAKSALLEFYAGRQCLRLSPASYNAELAFGASDGGWANQFGHRAPAPLRAFQRACEALKAVGSPVGPILADLQAARVDAATSVDRSVDLITLKLQAATTALNDFLQPKRP